MSGRERLADASPGARIVAEGEQHAARESQSLAGLGRQPATLDDLSPLRQEQVRLRFAHVMEAETGFRSGDRFRALPGEPRSQYDPATTSLAGRRRAKATELKVFGAGEAALLGLAHVSERTLRRQAAAVRRSGAAGLISGDWVRARGTRPAITREVREAIAAVRAETLHRSRVSMKTRERMIRQYVREMFGPDVPVPCYTTLRAVWIEWFGPGGARQRYARSAARLQSAGEHVVIGRPGQVVALDTTELAVMVREGMFGEAVPVHLTLAMDVYTHSLAAFRLTLVSDISTDVAMLLRDVMLPLPMRPGWGADMEWPYPGIPAAVVAQLAGYKVAALPFFAPETVTTDHGSVYKNHHLVEAQRVIGVNILPARVLRPTDKQAVERAFAAIQSLLLEFLLGYRGVDAADRGEDPAGDAVWTIDEMEQLIATWVVKIWQNRVLGGHAPAWDPGGRHSPNTLFAAAMAQGGFGLQIPAAELFYELLPAHHVKIHNRRGVKIKGLWYDGPALDPYRNTPPPRGGVHAGTWRIHRDPRDRRFAFFQDPEHQWHVLRWTGLPPEGTVPSFADARVQEMLRAARDGGQAPRTDAELLPVLLELIGGHTPVTEWPTQIPRHKRTGHAREAAQGEAAAADRPAPPPEPRPGPGPGSEAGATVAAMRWPDRARQAADAVDDERRRRREQALAGQAITAPPRMGDELRRRSLLILPGEDDDATVTTAAAHRPEAPR